MIRQALIEYAPTIASQLDKPRLTAGTPFVFSKVAATGSVAPGRKKGLGPGGRPSPKRPGGGRSGRSVSTARLYGTSDAVCKSSEVLGVRHDVVDLVGFAAARMGAWRSDYSIQ